MIHMVCCSRLLSDTAIGWNWCGCIINAWQLAGVMEMRIKERRKVVVLGKWVAIFRIAAQELCVEVEHHHCVLVRQVVAVEHKRPIKCSELHEDIGYRVGAQQGCIAFPLLFRPVVWARFATIDILKLV